jgi:cytochrome c-type biogenesis protein CcmH
VKLLGVLLLLAAGAVHAAIETFDFDNEEQRLRYLEFARELRCPKCQNQNLADSNAPIAEDLRQELHRLLIEGKTDQDILDFMVTCYGEYVLYEPRLETKTLLLWGAPVLMLCGGVLVLAGIVRRARAGAARQAAATAALSDAERRRLETLLGDGDKS